MNKEELLKAIEQKRQEVWPTDTGKMAPATAPNNLEQGWLNALKWMEDFINSLPAEQPNKNLDEEIKEYFASVDLKEVTFADIAKHFAQWQKEQLMKNAVETKVQGRIDGKGVFVDTDIPIGINVNEDDNVKIIIIKENEK